MKNIVLGIVCLLSANAYCQQMNKCATDDMVRKSLAEHPELVLEHDALEAISIQADATPGSPEVATVYIIPVVFHILHNYGAENISDAQVIDEVRILNEDYRKRNYDTIDVVSTFQPIIADCEIEFRLATKDPSGNCTNGIDRIATPLTYFGNDAAKLNPWPRNKYLNIWVAADLENSGAAAYAYLPGTAPSSAADGVICISHYVGSVGTGSHSTSRVLTHEIGHFLNLLHTWGNTNSPEVACGGTDNVSDTPETQGSTTCNLTLSVCNPPAIENVQNYMDYAYCDRMFTEGQKTRMRTALTATAGQRNQLWTSTNLTATGALASPAPTCAPKADFAANYTSICSNTSVTYSDLSWNGKATSWSWIFTGGSPATSTDSMPVVSYSTPGLYQTKLTATNSAGNNSMTKTSYIEVLDATNTGVTPVIEGFESVGAPTVNHWQISNVDAGSPGWQQTSTAHYSGGSSIFLNNFTGNTPGETDAFISPIYDFTTSTKKEMTFRVSYCQTGTSDNDLLTVSLSSNCGSTWGIRYTKSGATLATRTAKTSSFKPTAASEWRTETVNIAPYVNKDNVRIKFEFTCGGGNNIYIDDICILGALGAEEFHTKGFTAEVNPNPATSNSYLSLNLEKEEKVSYSISNLVGQTVFVSEEKSFSGGVHEIPISFDVSQGLYFVQVKAGDNSIVRKVTVAK